MIGMEVYVGEDNTAFVYIIEVLPFLQQFKTGRLCCILDIARISRTRKTKLTDDYLEMCFSCDHSLSLSMIPNTHRRFSFDHSCTFIRSTILVWFVSSDARDSMGSEFRVGTISTAIIYD